MNEKTSKLQIVFDDYKNNLDRYKDDIDLSHITYNKSTANSEELIKTEKKLGCTLPKELKEYYLNSANGSEENIEEYGSNNYSFDIFSHQKIFGIVDFSAHYWKDVGEDKSPFEYNTSILEKLPEKEQDRLKVYNKEFFVCIVDWDDNFLSTFVFDKKNRFYLFYFDQDETIGDYITELLNGDIPKKYSLSALVNDHLQEKINDLKEEFEH